MAKLLNSFLPIVFPAMRDIPGPCLSCYWTSWQSEWTTDIIITSSSDKLSVLMEPLLRHAHMTGTSTRVLRYQDRPLTKAGKPDRRSSDDVITRLTDFNDGIRCRHWVGNNSVKVYKVDEYVECNIVRIY